LNKVRSKDRDTIAIMVSVGSREHLSNYTYPRLSAWASSHGYGCLLPKEDLGDKDIEPHFIKLLAYKAAPGYQRYIIIDDDLLLRTDSPPQRLASLGSSQMVSLKLLPIVIKPIFQPKAPN
jgi:hypothetical protein